ncbi:actin-41-like [Penaeus monodon]|uniref:actin-41-like n=1 Tax=Penaeus monodon TaxID=6687 RepID=UPI0018A7A717|nr:actin-41-like [Penaeus monodon]
MCDDDVSPWWFERPRMVKPASPERRPSCRFPSISAAPSSGCDGRHGSEGAYVGRGPEKRGTDSQAPTSTANPEKKTQIIFEPLTTAMYGAHPGCVPSPWSYHWYCADSGEASLTLPPLQRVYALPHANLRFDLAGRALPFSLIRSDERGYPFPTPLNVKSFVHQGEIF